MDKHVLWRGHTLREIVANEDLYREWLADMNDARECQDDDRRDHYNTY